MMTQHEQIAQQIADGLASDTKVAENSARQGDVFLSRVRGTSRSTHEKTPAGGVQIAAGQHGEHRLIGPAVAWPEPGVVSLREPAVLVHTDVPEARHAAVVLSPGTWEYRQLRELGVNDVVESVRD